MKPIQTLLRQDDPNERVYVIVGTEQLLIDRAVAAIKRATVGDDSIGLNTEAFDGKSITGAAVVAAANTLPMMSERRFVWLRGAEALSAAEQAPLVDYFDSPASTTALVITATKLDGRSKLARAAKKAGLLFEAKALSHRAVPDFVRDELKALGHAISPRALSAIVDAIGADLGVLNDAVQRLSLYAGPGQRIDEDMVHACVTRVRTETIWALVDAIGLKHQKRAIEAAGSLLADREPALRILAMITRQLRIVAKMREALANGMTPQDAAKEAGAPPFKARDLTSAAKNFDATQLGAAFQIVAATDRALKGSKRPDAVILQQAVMQLTG